MFLSLGHWETMVLYIFKFHNLVNLSFTNSGVGCIHLNHLVVEQKLTDSIADISFRHIPLPLWIALVAIKGISASFLP